MAFAFLNSIIIEPDFPENDDESDVELDPQDLDDDPQDLDDSDTDPPEPQSKWNKEGKKKPVTRSWNLGWEVRF